MSKIKKETVVPARSIFYKCYVDDMIIHGKEKIIDKPNVLFYTRNNFIRDRASKTPLS